MIFVAGTEMLSGNRVNSADANSYIATRSDEPTEVVAS